MRERTPGTLLPPARTRTGATGSSDGSAATLLPPARSGLTASQPRPVPEPPVPATAADETFEAPADVGEVVTHDIAAEEVTIELTGFTELEVDEEAPVNDDDAAEHEVTFDLVADDEVEWAGEDSEPWEESEPADTARFEIETEPVLDELVLDDDEVVKADQTDPEVPADQADPEIRKAPPPLSPWDLGAASATTAEGERAARARAEWESLGQALSDSLETDPLLAEPGPHGYELTDEKAAELDAGTGSPFGGPVMAVGSTGSGRAESPVSELVRRLENFATRLRDEGPAALSRAQAGDDRFDALLASIAAGFLAGRGE